MSPHLVPETTYNFLVDKYRWRQQWIRDKQWYVMEKSTANAWRFLLAQNQMTPFLLNVSHFVTHAVVGNVHQDMWQNANMDMHANNTIPAPPTTLGQAWCRMQLFFGGYHRG